jgi:hypothetical protein
MIKVEGHPNLVRDETTGAITNVNSSAYSNYLIRKANQDADRDELDEMKTDLDNIRNDISEIKNLLLQLKQQ